RQLLPHNAVTRALLAHEEGLLPRWALYDPDGCGQPLQRFQEIDSDRAGEEGPGRVFEVLVVRGWGFVGKPTGTGRDPGRTARAWAELMKQKENEMSRNEAAGELIFNAILPEDIHWTALPALAQSARLADIVDHPSEHPPYVIRVKVSAGTRVMPH